MSSGARRHRARSRDLLSAYLDEIGEFPLVSRDEEVILANRARAGDSTALDRLVCANLRFVVSIAKRYQTHGVPLIDLINEGNIGLILAAEKFDETKGVKFISYAIWWVRQMVFQALAEQGAAVRVPVGQAVRVLRVRRQAEALRQTFYREPTRDELATASDSDPSSSASLFQSAVSLDAEVGDDATLLDYLPSDDYAPDQVLLDTALSASVDDALRQLSEREVHVVRRYFGFDGVEAATLETIGDEMGITRERVRQIKERALRKIRKSIHRETLAAFHE